MFAFSFFCSRRNAARLAVLLAVAGLPAALRADLSHRQATVTVKTENLAGAALNGATVKVEMLNPAFRFGTAIVTDELTPGTASYSAQGLAAVQTYFNSVTFGNYMKWTYFESRPVATTLAMIDRVFALRAFNADVDMALRGHTTVWGASYQLPADLRAMTSAADVKARILSHVTEYHTAFKGSGVTTFDLYNEHFHEREFIMNKAVPGSTASTMIAEQAAVAADWFKAAQAADPAAKLFINEYNILNFWVENDSDVKAYKAFIDAVRDAGGPVGGIGLQAHIDRMLSKEQITRRLNLLAAPMPATVNHPAGLPGLPIEVTELDINTQGWTSATPEQQAQVTANILDACYENPAVEGITIWGIRDSIHWRGNAIMYNDSNPNNWVLKPSGQAWVDRVKGTWWTNLSGTTSAAGTTSGTVFKGLHRITVTYDGVTKQVVQQLTSDETVTVKFDTTPVDTSGSFLSNLSVRAPLAAGQKLTLGFVVDGGAKEVLARVAGPALEPYLANFVADPAMEITRNGNPVTSNDNWVAADVQATANRLGAFPFAPGSKDAALIATLNGGHATGITGVGAGIVLGEIYDVAPATTGPRLTNVSALHFTGTGDDVLTAGFVVGGSGHARLLIRGVGPELASQFGVQGVLANPIIRVYDRNGQEIAVNDDWDSSLTGTMATLGAFPLTAGSKDAALLLVVPADALYSVRVSGADGGTGLAIIEVYEVR